MSKRLARSPQSYENEIYLLELIPEILKAHDFISIKIKKSGAMKFLIAERRDKTEVCFWLKQGWTNAKDFCAVQFGLFPGPNSASIDDSAFLELVSKRCDSAKKKGATYALFVHVKDLLITNWVALPIDDVKKAYREQLRKWPKRARNTKTPTLWFEDDRNVADRRCISAVTRREISLLAVSNSTQGVPVTQDESPAFKKVTVEVERRMMQARFRHRVGKAFKWRCAVTGISIRQVLDAAHLPGRDWRHQNSEADGVLLRSDLHKLMDTGLATIENGFFVLTESIRRSASYRAFHNTAITWPNA